MRPPAAGTVLDRQTLNRTLLARQGLLTRGTEAVGDVVERLVGMQAQVPRDPYIGLWARVRDFDPVSLEALLLERRAVRMTLMRATLHLATARDAVVLRSAVQSVCERLLRSSPFARRLGGMDLDALCQACAALLVTRPMTVAELGTALAARWPEGDREAMAYAARYLLPVVQVTPRGLLSQSAVPRLAMLQSWLGRAGEWPPGSRPASDDVIHASDGVIDTVVERYLRAFGPATVADIRAWSGIANLRTVLRRMAPRLRSYRDTFGRQLLDVADGVFADGGEPAPARLLGEYDNVFLGHADRSRITGDLVWGSAWARRGAFFVDGYLAGAWRLPDRGDPARIELEARRQLSSAARNEVAREATALVRFLVAVELKADIIWTA